MFDFTEKVVLVTGAAGHLGLAVAQAFGQAGATLVLTDRGANRLAGFFPELVQDTRHWLKDGMDLTDEAVVKAFAAEVYVRYGKMDVLVNTVGGYHGGTPVQKTPLETWDLMFDINARTAFNTCKAVSPFMLAQGGGKIINIGGRAALSGSRGMAAYSASKAAVVRLTESLAAELKDADINVNCILPGTIDTPEYRAENQFADFNRWVTPEALADVILFLASPAARGIHGAAIPVYGKG